MLDKNLFTYRATVEWGFSNDKPCTTSPLDMNPAEQGSSAPTGAFPGTQSLYSMVFGLVEKNDPPVSLLLLFPLLETRLYHLLHQKLGLAYPRCVLLYKAF